jgi:hypothetical protein
MNVNAEVIWRKGDLEMPENVKHVVLTAQNELLLRSLQLPVDVANTIRYNASKNNKTINEYISSLVLENIEAV